MSFQNLVIPDIINVIASKCDLDTIDNLTLSSNEIKNIIDKNIKIEKMKEIFPDFLHTYIDFNSEFMFNSKKIDIPDKYGITGYIDFFKFTDFQNENYNTNILYGFDGINRFFISVLYKDITLKKYNIVTFFQRYNEIENYFVSCQTTFIISTWCATFSFYKDNSEKLNEFYKILFKLLNTGEAVNDSENEYTYHYKLE